MLISAKKSFDAESTQTLKKELEKRSSISKGNIDASDYNGQNALNSAPMYFYRNKYMLESPAWGISVSDFQFSERMY